MGKCVYFDNAAAAPVDPEMLACFVAESRIHYANAEAVNLLAYRTRKALAQGAKRLSKCLTGEDDHPVIWGNSATELFRMASSLPEFVSSCGSPLEHPALTANLKNFTDYHAIPVNGVGEIAPDGLQSCDLACLFQVQSELGIIQEPVNLFPQLTCRCRLTDAVQAAGKLPLDNGADILIVSGVKFGAPGGAAMLLNPHCRFTDKLLDHAANYRKKAYALSRVSVPLMLALVAAAEKAVSQMDERLKKMSELHDFIRRGTAELGIGTTLPETLPVSPYILNLMLEHQEAAVVVRALGEKDIYVAAGSACSAESGEPSAALTALGIRGKKAYRALRLSFWEGNSMEDGEIFLKELKNVLKNY